MAGLINAAQSEVQEAPEAPPQDEQPAGDQGAMNAEGAAPSYRTKVIEALPPEMRASFEKIIIGGLRIFYSAEMRDEIEAELARDVPVFKKVGEGVAKMMTVLDHASKKTMPTPLIIPAAIELAAEAYDFLAEAGKIQSNPDERQQTLIYATIATGKLYHVPDADMQKVFQQQGSGQKPGAEPPDTEPPPPASPPAAPPMMGA